MATIYIDKQPYQVHEGQNLLQACLSLGFDLPYFCWHPAMHSVGACRQCAVKAFAHGGDTRGRIVMACMTPVEDGLCISIDDPEAVEFRRTVIEWLMVNHPHDCPVCDEGGECHLQDMTVMTGHDYRRYRFKKRTHRNQDLGPFLTHEMNRCIQCYRCVRFYRDFAGGDDLAVMGWHDNVYFGRSSAGALASEFAGNLVEVCPTGVFTDKTLSRHYARKWDLQTAPSVCVHCGLGCNTIPGERYGTLRRVHNRFNAQVNGYFLCDRGRYGYEFVNGPSRLRQALRRRDNKLVEADPDEIVAEVAGIVGDGWRVIGVASPRASLEANYALRAMVGPERFFDGLSKTEGPLLAAILDILRTGPARTPSLREIESADAVLVLGEDPTNSAPMLDFAIRQAVRQKSFKLADELKIDRWNDYAVRNVMQADRSPLFIVTPTATKLDGIAAGTLRAAPDDIAALAQAMAAIIEGNAVAVGCAGSCPKGKVLHTTNQEGPGTWDQATAEAASGTESLPARIAAALMAAERPVIISGTGCGHLGVIQSTAAVAWALCRAGKRAGLFYTTPECNSMGLAMMSARPLKDAAAVLRAGQADTLIVLENDLFRRMPGAAVKALLDAAKNVVVLDCLQTTLTERAHFVLPSASFAESDGTLVNNEGRAQRSYKVFQAQEPVRESWRWLRDIMVAAGRAEGAAWQRFDDVAAAMVADMPQFAGVAQVAPSADFRMYGMRIARQPHRYSGRTAMAADVSVHEPQSPQDADSPLSFSMEGCDAQPPSALLARYWAPGWNSVQALNKFQAEVGSLLRQSMPGVRLIEPTTTTRTTFTAEGAENAESNHSSSENGHVRGSDPPLGKGSEPEALARAPFCSRAAQGQWLVVPVWHIFGSDELSAHSPGVAGLTPEPYLAMTPADAELIGAKEDQFVDVKLVRYVNGTFVDEKLRLKLLLRADLPSGVAAMPAKLRRLSFVDLLPEWAQIQISPSAAGQGGEQ